MRHRVYRAQLAFEKAKPASRLASIMLLRYSRLFGSVIDFWRLELISRTACSACISVSGECRAIHTLLLRAPVRPFPCKPVRDASMVVSVVGSIREMSGTTALLMISSLRLMSRSVITAIERHRQTSLPLWECIWSGASARPRCTRPQSLGWRPDLPQGADAFAQSMTLPPPTATMMSQPCSAYTTAPAAISSMRGLG